MDHSSLSYWKPSRGLGQGMGCSPQHNDTFGQPRESVSRLARTAGATPSGQCP
jgi:hypothetical protein